MSRLFTHPDAWSGGNIDALMFFGMGDCHLAEEVARAVWSYPQLMGPYCDRTLEPEQQPIVNLNASAEDIFSEDGCGQMVGLLFHPNGNRTPFVHTTVIDDDGLWVYIGPTLGGLSLHFSIGAYPFDDGTSTDWLTPLFSELRAITNHVSSTVPPKAAMYGWLDLSDLDAVKAALGGHIPTERWTGLDLWQNGSRTYFPPTQWSAPMKVDK